MTKDLADELERRSKACLDMARQPSTRGDTNDATRLRAKASAYAHAAEMAISALRANHGEVEPVAWRRSFLDAPPTERMIEAGLDHNHRHNSTENMIASFQAMLAQAEIDGLIYTRPVAWPDSEAVARVIEGILFRRAIQQRVDGYVRESAEEISEAVLALFPQGETE